MAAIETLGGSTLQELIERTDKYGVLSVYVNSDPVDDPSREAVAIDLRNRFRELEQYLERTDDTEHGRQSAEALTHLWPSVQELANRRKPGRSRIAFFGLYGEWVLQFDSAMAVPTRVVWDDGPFIHPLLEMLDAGRTTGVVIVSAADAKIYEWQLGAMHRVRRMEREYVEASHERAGQIGGGPSGQFHGPVREHRQARDRARTNRFIDTVANAVVQADEERRWERLLVSGGRWTNECVSRLPQNLQDKTVTDSRNLSSLDDAALADTVSSHMREWHGQWEDQLVARVRDAAGEGTAVIGLPDVIAALNRGQAEHLVYDSTIRYKGNVDENGLLGAGDEATADGRQIRTEQRLTERLVARALGTGARVSPVDGAADKGLAAADGIAALLRWRVDRAPAAPAAD